MTLSQQAADLQKTAELTGILARMQVLMGYLEIFGSHPDDPKRDMRDLTAYVDRQPAPLRARLIEAHNVPNGWKSSADALRSLRSALFSPEEEAQYLPKLAESA